MKFRTLVAAVMSCLVAACGGGGGGGDSGPPPTSADQSELTITMTASAPTVPVGVIRWFDVVVANRGAAAARSPQLLMNFNGILEGGTECEAFGGAVCSSTSWSYIPALPAHSALRIRFFVEQTQRGTVTLEATATASNLVGGTPATGRLDLTAYQADLEVSGSTPAGELAVGAPASYTMTVTNAGPDTATDAVISTILDANQKLTALGCTAAGGAVCPASLGRRMAAPAIPKGGSLQFTVSAQPWPGTVGTIANEISVSALGDPDIYDNQATVRTRVAIASNPGSLVQLQSETGDPIGFGLTNVYDRNNALLVFEPSGASLRMRVIGNETWSADLQLPGGLSRWQVGTHAALPRDALDWSSGRCGSSLGSITVDEATYVGSTLTLLDLRFEQHCDGAAGTLRGRVRWTASDTAPAPGPIVPSPDGLWQAPAGAVPATGSYFYASLEPWLAPLDRRDSGVYTLSDSVMKVDANGRFLVVQVNGDTRWRLDFRAMESLSQLQPGYYRGLGTSASPTRGFLSFDPPAGCSFTRGWVVIDEVTYTAGALSSIALRFEQRCDNESRFLNGQMRWSVNDTTQPPGPQVPPPDLWAAPAGSTPASGNYVYLESDAGDYIGQGLTRLLTPAQGAISVTNLERRVRIGIDTPAAWSGEFHAMSSIPRLAPGFYFGVLGAPFHNPATGGLSWGGDGRGCNEAWGWFVVDGVSYSGDEITSLDLRFAQHCEFGEPALRGQVHWVK